MPTVFPSRMAYRREVKRRFAKIMPPLVKYATPSGAATCPPALRQEIPLPEWLTLPQADRESIIKAAIRNMIYADLGPLPAPAEGQDKPRPRLDPAPAPAPVKPAPVKPAPVEPAPVEPAPTAEPASRVVRRYVTRCATCEKEFRVDSPRPRVTYCKKHERV